MQPKTTVAAGENSLSLAAGRLGSSLGEGALRADAIRPYEGDEGSEKIHAGAAEGNSLSLAAGRLGSSLGEGALRADDIQIGRAHV